MRSQTDRLGQMRNFYFSREMAMAGIVNLLAACNLVSAYKIIRYVEIKLDFWSCLC